MKGLTLFRRTTKSEGMIKLRFRLKDGREVDLYHKSETKADIKDLANLKTLENFVLKYLSTITN